MNIYCQSKDMADFLKLRGKLEPKTLFVFYWESLTAVKRTLPS